MMNLEIAEGGGGGVGAYNKMTTKKRGPLPVPYSLCDSKDDSWQYLDEDIKWGIFLGLFFVMYFIQHCFICRPSDSIVSEDAGIEPMTVNGIEPRTVEGIEPWTVEGSKPGLLKGSNPGLLRIEPRTVGDRTQDCCTWTKTCSVRSGRSVFSQMMSLSLLWLISDMAAPVQYTYS